MDLNEDRMLRALDPGESDPGYWPRFQREVVARAQFELARRREEVRVTISRMLFGWSRTVVPAALAAAAVAMFMLMESGRATADPTQTPLVDILTAGATFDPSEGLVVPVTEPLEEAVPTLTLVALEEGY